MTTSTEGPGAGPHTEGLVFESGWQPEDFLIDQDTIRVDGGSNETRAGSALSFIGLLDTLAAVESAADSFRDGMLPGETREQAKARMMRRRYQAKEFVQTDGRPYSTHNWEHFTGRYGMRPHTSYWVALHEETEVECALAAERARQVTSLALLLSPVGAGDTLEVSVSDGNEEVRMGGTGVGVGEGGGEGEGETGEIIPVDEPGPVDLEDPPVDPTPLDPIPPVDPPAQP